MYNAFIRVNGEHVATILLTNTHAVGFMPKFHKEGVEIEVEYAKEYQTVYQSMGLHSSTEDNIVPPIKTKHELWVEEYIKLHGYAPGSEEDLASDPCEDKNW